jgi:hypothetical protein
MLSAPNLFATRERVAMADVDAGTDAAPPIRRPRRRALKVLLALGLLVALLLAGLPYGIQWGIRTALLKAGADAAEVGDVDANPFTLRLVVKGLAVTHRGEQVLQVGRAEARADWRSLLVRRVLLKEAAIDDAHVRVVRLPDGTFAGVLAPPPGEGAPATETAGSGWGFGVAALDVTRSEVRYEAPDQGHALAITHLGLKGLATWLPEGAAPVHLDGAVDGGVLKIDGVLLAFAEHPSAKARVRVTGLPLSNLQPLAPVVADLSGSLTLDQQVALGAQADGLRFAQRGTVLVTDLGLSVQGRALSAGRLSFSGDVGAALPHDGAPAWAVDGRLSGEALGGDQIPGGRSARLAGLGVEGRADGGSGGITASGRVRLTDLALVRDHPEAQLALLEQAGFEGVKVAIPGAVEVSRAAFTGLVLTPPVGPEATPTPLLSLGAADLEGLRATRAAVDLNTLRLSAPDVLLVRDIDGRFADLEALLAALAPPGPPPPPKGEEGAAPPSPREEEAPVAAPVAFRLGEATLALGGRVRVRDRSVKPPYEAVVDLEQASLKGLDTAHPHTPAEVALGGTVGGYTQVALHGTLAPLAERLTMDLSGEVTHLELPPLDPYAAPALGYHLDAGQLGAKLRLGADQGRLDGSADLDVRGLNVSPVKGARRSVSEGLPMPLESALDLLKDRDDVIRITVPVSGDLEDPKVGIGDIVNEAVTNGLKTSAMTYAKVALQPFGAILFATEMAGKALALRLDPMPFEPGSAALTDTGRDYAAKIAKLLTDRPGLHVRLCGRAAAGDRGALATAPQDSAAPAAPATTSAADPEAALLDLASARAEGLKAHLVRDHGVDPGRLLICRPEVDPEPEAVPRVDMLI